LIHEVSSLLVKSIKFLLIFVFVLFLSLLQAMSQFEMEFCALKKYSLL